MSFIKELKRRNVFRVGIAYAIGGWLLLQLADVLSELLDLPDVVGRSIVLVVAIGLPVALFLAWAFELTPEGVKREKDVDRSQSITQNTGKKLNYVVVGMLVVAAAYFFWESRLKSGTVIPAKVGTSQSSDASNQIPASAGMTDQDKDKSIAVLPFTNRSPNPDDAYFTDGIHDDLLTQLAKIKTFSVISRTSVMEYRDTTKNLKQIGKELGVSDIMEGSVQRSGDRVRINVQLINADTDKHLWAEIYDRKLTTDNLFDIQSEIAQAIARALHATLTDSEIASVADVPTNNVAAYDFYQQAKRFALDETEIGFETAIDLYTEALSLDPQFKLAWTGLAYAHISNYWNYGGKDSDLEKARQAINKAKAIDPDFPELYIAEGGYYYWGLLDYDTAIEYIDKAIALMPGNAEAYMWKGWASRRAGYWEQSIAAMQQSLKLNPRVQLNWTEFGQTLAYQGRYDEAVAAVEQGYKVDPDNYWGRTALAYQLIIQSGNTERATKLVIGAQHANESGFTLSYWVTMLMARRFDAAMQAARDWPPEWEINRSEIVTREQYIADTFMAMGRKTEAQEHARLALQGLEAMKKEGMSDYRIPFAELRAHAILGEGQKLESLKQAYLANRPRDLLAAFDSEYIIAISYAFAGMHTECIETLDQLLSNPNSISVPWLQQDPRLDTVRDDPEFIAMLERHR